MSILNINIICRIIIIITEMIYYHNDDDDYCNNYDLFLDSKWK